MKPLMSLLFLGMVFLFTGCLSLETVSRQLTADFENEKKAYQTFVETNNGMAFKPAEPMANWADTLSDLSKHVEQLAAYMEKHPEKRQEAVANIEDLLRSIEQIFARPVKRVIVLKPGPCEKDNVASAAGKLFTSAMTLKQSYERIARNTLGYRWEWSFDIQSEGICNSPYLIPPGIH